MYAFTFQVPQDKTNRAVRIETNRRLAWNRRGVESRQWIFIHMDRSALREVPQTRTTDLSWEVEQAEVVMAPEPVENHYCPTMNLVRTGFDCLACDPEQGYLDVS